MTNRPSGIMELPDGSSVRASAILAIVHSPIRAVTVVLAAEGGIEFRLEDGQPASQLIAELTAQWRAALGERTEPEQSVVAEFKEGDRVRHVRGHGIGTVQNWAITGRRVTVKWDNDDGVFSYPADDLEQS